MSAILIGRVTVPSHQETRRCPWGSHVVSPLQTSMASCFSKKYTSDCTLVTPLFTNAPITLGPSPRSSALHTRPFLNRALLTDISSLAPDHIPKWARHENGPFAAPGACQADARAASSARHALAPPSGKFRLALQGQLQCHPQRPSPSFPPSIFFLPPPSPRLTKILRTLRTLRTLPYAFTHRAHVFIYAAAISQAPTMCQSIGNRALNRDNVALFSWSLLLSRKTGITLLNRFC